MKQLPLPTLTPPTLTLKQLRKAVGGAHRLQALDRRKAEDMVDAVLGRVLVTALEARDTRTRRAAQAFGFYACCGNGEARRAIWRLSAATLLEKIVTLAQEATDLRRAKRLIQRWIQQEEQRRRAQGAELHERTLRLLESLSV